MMPQYPHQHQHQPSHRRAAASGASTAMRGPGPSATRTQCTPIKLDYSTKHKSEAVWHMVHNEYPDGLTAERFLEAIKQLCVDHGDHVRSARNRGAFTTDDVVIQFVRRVWRLGPVEVWVDLGRRTTVSLKWQLATMQNGWDDDWLHVKYHF